MLNEQLTGPRQKKFLCSQIMGQYLPCLKDPSGSEMFKFFNLDIKAAKRKKMLIKIQFLMLLTTTSFFSASQWFWNVSTCSQHSIVAT